LSTNLQKNCNRCKKGGSFVQMLLMVHNQNKPIRIHSSIRNLCRKRIHQGQHSM